MVCNKNAVCGDITLYNVNAICGEIKVCYVNNIVYLVGFFL